jgi:hypothetical protein
VTNTRSWRGAEGEDDRKKNIRLTRRAARGHLRRGIRRPVRHLQAHPCGLRVTLVDGHLYSTFQPLLYQVATAAATRRRRLPGRRLLRGGTERSSARGSWPRRPASRRIKLSNGHDIGYDYLILATGVTTAFYGVKGAADTRSASIPGPTPSCSVTT